MCAGLIRVVKSTNVSDKRSQLIMIMKGFSREECVQILPIQKVLAGRNEPGL